MHIFFKFSKSRLTSRPCLKQVAAQSSSWPHNTKLDCMYLEPNLKMVFTVEEASELITKDTAKASSEPMQTPTSTPTCNTMVVMQPCQSWAGLWKPNDPLCFTRKIILACDLMSSVQYQRKAEQDFFRFFRGCFKDQFLVLV